MFILGVHICSLQDYDKNINPAIIIYAIINAVLCFAHLSVDETKRQAVIKHKAANLSKNPISEPPHFLIVYVKVRLNV